MALSAKQQAWLDALEDALYSGVLEVSHGDRTVKYRSMNELMRAIEMLKASAGVGGAGKMSRRYAEFSRE